MPKVQSSAISSIEHDAATLQLHVTFHETGTYTYFGVPQSVYDAFLKASSPGRFFNDHIRDRYKSNR